jgi:hypothetical protein
MVLIKNQIIVTTEMVDHVCYLCHSAILSVPYLLLYPLERANSGVIYPLLLTIILSAGAPNRVACD